MSPLSPVSRTGARQRVVAQLADLLLFIALVIPMLGLVFTYFEFDRWPRRGGLLLVVWSAALVAGAASWLAGRTSGKPFLDWSGGARVVFLGMLAALASGGQERFALAPAALIFRRTRGTPANAPATWADAELMMVLVDVRTGQVLWRTVAFAIFVVATIVAFHGFLSGARMPSVVMVLVSIVVLALSSGGGSAG